MMAPEAVPVAASRVYAADSFVGLAEALAA